MIPVVRRSLAISAARAPRQTLIRSISAHTTSRPALLPHGCNKNSVPECLLRRFITTYNQSDITMQEYHQASDTTMEALLDSLEHLVDQHTDLPYEVDYSSGVLTLNLADKGIYVINKQPPNKQIWLSSPRSGPKRYDLDATEKEWFYTRDNTTMRSLLENELTDVFGKPIQLDLGDQA